MNKRERLKSNVFRSKIRLMLLAGFSASKIAKKTGKSYTHVKLICDQEIKEMLRTNID